MLNENFVKMKILEKFKKQNNIFFMKYTILITFNPDLSSPQLL